MTTSPIDRISAYLNVHLSEKRLKHILGVRDAAVEYAGTHGLSVEQAELAALLHDCAKWMPLEEQFALCERYEVPLTENDRWQPAVLHAYVAAEIARRDFGMDEAICRAIRAHTTGWNPMSELDMALYVADFSEPSRPYPEAVEIRQTALKSLLDATIATMTFKLSVLLARGGLIHPRTVDARNALLLRVATVRNEGEGESLPGESDV